jgi:hypothetical protein
MITSRMSHYRTTDKPFINCPNSEVSYHVVQTKVGPGPADG